MDSGNSDASKRKIVFWINFSSANSYTTNLDYFFIRGVTGVGYTPKTNNTITWDWENNTILSGGCIAVGY